MTTRIVTREYDAEGRLVREVETTYESPAPYYYQPGPAWWQQPLVTWTTGGTTSVSPNSWTVN